MTKISILMATSPTSSHLVILVTSLFCTEIKFWPKTGSKFMIKNDQIWFLLVSWGFSVGCLVRVWKVSGGLRKVSVGCLVGVWRVSGGVWGMSGGCLRDVLPILPILQILPILANPAIPANSSNPCQSLQSYQSFQSCQSLSIRPILPILANPCKSFKSCQSLPILSQFAVAQVSRGPICHTKIYQGPEMPRPNLPGPNMPGPDLPGIKSKAEVA